ncbi:S-phase kinase-associated protein 2-like [Maniola jurtina]|uniref:S-phase kinase-associated protein 2-like n=1 Tax=Maniola jurtina TaxID=191418 RepID=UPI001E68DF01|nr:S-phase kinase-associated protein 2-like [Maniola jurtina]
MDPNSTEDDNLPSPVLDVMENPRKRVRLENSPRKSWSLMDRRADKEVLQEMGVSLLEPDDGDPNCDAASINNAHKPNLKRKRDLENVNPNINNIIMSPRGKYSPKSPRGKFSTSPGPSRIKSPRSSEKLKPLQPSDQTLETSVSHAYLVDEETPLGQSVSADYKGLNAGTSSGKKRISDNSFNRNSLEEDQRVQLAQSYSRQDDMTQEDTDTFSLLSDEVILGVMSWLPKRTLAHCMLVCKRWYRIACTESLWQRLDLANKALPKDSLGSILDRKPVVVRFASAEIAEWHPTSMPIQSRIQLLDLSMCTIDHKTLEQLLVRCSGVRKLSLESVNLSEAAQKLIGKCANIEVLNLTMAQGITVEGLTAILEGCTGVQSLNISWCYLSEEALRILVEMLPQNLQRLNLGGARALTDDMVTALVARCPLLIELDLSDCSRLAVASLSALLSLSRLEHLALSRCYLLPPHALTKLSSMASLQFLEVWGMLHTASTNALRAALPAIQINQYKFSAIARPTVGTRRTSIWGVRTRD